MKQTKGRVYNPTRAPAHEPPCAHAQVLLGVSALAASGSGAAAAVDVLGGRRARVHDGVALFKDVTVVADRPGTYLLDARLGTHKARDRPDGRSDSLEGSVPAGKPGSMSCQSNAAASFSAACVIAQQAWLRVRACAGRRGRQSGKVLTQ